MSASYSEIQIRYPAMHNSFVQLNTLHVNGEFNVQPYKMSVIEIKLIKLLYLVLRFQAGIHWILALSPLSCGHPYKTGFRFQIMMLLVLQLFPTPPPPPVLFPPIEVPVVFAVYIFTHNLPLSQT
jgi:hypothetical protein